MAVKTVSLIPEPKQLLLRDGDFTLSPETQIFCGLEVANEAAFLANRLCCAIGFPFEQVTVLPKVGNSFIGLMLNDQYRDLGKEGYHLEVGANHVWIRSAEAAGVFRGIQTLFQLLPPAIYGRGPRVNVAWIIPHVSIKDAPEYSWRGAMLDCSRHFMPSTFIKKFIDVLAMHKLNVFHWHLTDNQGWRIEIKKYPKLTEIGAFRSETQKGHYDAHAGGDNTPHGGFYSQEDIKEIVAYAAARHITVLPEIEVPAHCQAALAAYPEFGPLHYTPEVSTGWESDPNAIFAPSEATFHFLKDILAEVCELFPSKLIHIGGDEAAKDWWVRDPSVRKIMAECGISSANDLQGYFIRRVRGILADLGRDLIGWDEILESGLDSGATVMAWRDMENVTTAALGSHNVVVCTMSGTYLDFYQSSNSEEEPLAIGPVLSLEQVYHFNPIPANLPIDAQEKILGLQAQLWSEYMPSPEIVEYMAFPRLIALSETAWSGNLNKDYAGFCVRLRRHLKRLDIAEVRYRTF